MYEADKLSRCVQWARRRYFTSEFTYFASINFTQDMTAAEMKVVWSKACRYLTNKNVIALYTCEVSRRSNHFNFHMLLRSQTPNLTELLKSCTKTVKTNIKVEPYDPGRGRLAVRYMTKAKTTKYKNGEIVSRDRWARKRVLLRQELKVRRYGTIGQFWPLGMNKEGIWNEIVAHERKINDGLQQPGAEEYAVELHELIGGYFPLNRVRRSVGFFGVPAGWVPKLDDDLVVVDDHDHHSDDADEPPPAPAPSESSEEAVKPLRMAAEAPNVAGVGRSRLEQPAAFYGPLLTTTTTPTPTARPPPRRVDLEGRRLNLPLHLPFRPLKTQGITAGSQVQRLVRRAASVCARALSLVVTNRRRPGRGRGRWQPLGKGGCRSLQLRLEHNALTAIWPNLEFARTDENRSHRAGRALTRTPRLRVSARRRALIG